MRLVIPGIAVPPGVTHSDSRRLCNGYTGHNILSRQHCGVATFYLDNIAALQHFISTTLRCCNILSRQLCDVATFYFDNIATLQHFISTTLRRCNHFISTTLRRCNILSRQRRDVATFYLDNVVMSRIKPDWNWNPIVFVQNLSPQNPFHAWV